MKRLKNIFEKIISDENLELAIDEVNRTHHWRRHHRPNGCTAWVEITKQERIAELRQIILNGFNAKPPRVSRIYDVSARKYRDICEPAQYPDQYVHHALIQVLIPTFMRGMDNYCCGSIKNRGTIYGKKSIERWISKDKKGTKYVLCCDIYHFYESLKPDIVMERMRRLIKDNRTLDLIWRTIKGGITIGAYTSQWYANTVLQPLDVIIRQSGYAKHYVRYMDNLTIFGSNKRHLRKLRVIIEQWLNEHGLKLKGDWQVFSTSNRMPDAVGYRYGKDFTIPRKKNFLRLKRAISRYHKRKRTGKQIYAEMAHSIISRLGQLKHCCNCNLYRILFKGERIVRELKKIDREYTKMQRFEWNVFLIKWKIKYDERRTYRPPDRYCKTTG